MVLWSSLYDKTWHSRKFSQHRPLWLHCTTGECNLSKYTRKHNFKNINKNHKKNKTKLTALYWPPPAPPPPPRNKGLLLPDSGAVSRLLVMIFFLISIFNSSIADWVSNGSWQPQTSLNMQVEGYLRSNKLPNITSNLLCTASNFLTNKQTSRRLFEN